MSRNGVLRAALVCWAAMGALFAQSSLDQQIGGQVTDASGAAVANATVAVVSQDTGLTRTTRSNKTGNYFVANLPAGRYRVTGEAQGFKKQAVSGLQLNTGLSLEVNLKLQVGSRSDSIDVVADIAQVELGDGEVGYTVTGEQASEIQLNGRNFPELLALIPGVSTTYQSSFTLFGGYGVVNDAQSVNGTRGDTITWNLGGADNKDNGGGGNNFTNINPDAIGEFRVSTSNFSASSGTSSGAVVNLALRGGTKRFHGKLYEYFRNDALSAYAFNALTKPKLRWNNLGWNVGGPVLMPSVARRLREKMFFFVGEDFKILRTGSVNTWTVPTAQNKGGDFGTSRVNDPTTGKPFPNNLIPGSLIDRNAQTLVNFYPDPNSGKNTLIFNETQPVNTRQNIFNFDYNATTKNQINIHYVHDYYDSLQNLTNLIQYWREIPGLNSSIQWSHVFSSRLVNVALFSFTGNVIFQKRDRVPNPIFLKDFTRAGNGIDYPLIYNASSDIPQLAVGGYTTLSVTSLNFDNFNRIFDWKDDVSKIIRNHTLKTGILVMRSRKNQDTDPATNGQFNFQTSRSPTSGNALADAMMGNFYQYTEASSLRQGWFRFWQVEPYVQDDWKVRRRLTVNLGLRWSYMQPQYSQLNNTAMFLPQFFNRADAASVDPKTGSITRAPNPYNGIVLTGSGFPDAAKGRVEQYGDPAVEALFHNLPIGGAYSQWGNFGPRVGFAFDLTGKGTTVLRGGFGATYERIQGNFIFGSVNNPPFIKQVTVLNGNIENPVGAVASPDPVQTISNSHYLDMKAPRTLSYSLGLQRKLGRTMSVTATYVGTAASNLSYRQDINQLPRGTLTSHPGMNANALRPYAGFGAIYEFNTGANSIYNSLQAHFRKQWSGAGIVSAAFTWSKARTDANSYSYQPRDSYDLRGDWGRSSYNRDRILVVSYVYPLPFWQHGARRWYEKGFGGWQISGVTQIQTGLPMNITLANDVAGTSDGSQRPNLVGDVYSGPGVGGRQYLNPKAFTVPASGQWGNLGAYAIVGPSWNNWNAALNKSFPVNERCQWNVRFEAFNFPNHFSYWGVNSGSFNGPNTANFGLVTSATDPRTLQASLRVSF
jgi:hypothetical protein